MPYTNILKNEELCKREPLILSDMKTSTKLKMEQKALKIYIYACGIGLTIYTGMLCFGLATPVAEWLSMTCGFLLLIGGAWMYHLCWLSYTTIVYIYLIRCCMVMKELGVFGTHLHQARWIMFIAGILLCALIFYKFFQKLCRDEESETDTQTVDKDGR